MGFKEFYLESKKKKNNELYVPKGDSKYDYDYWKSLVDRQLALVDTKELYSDYYSHKENKYNSHDAETDTWTKTDKYYDVTGEAYAKALTQEEFDYVLKYMPNTTKKEMKQLRNYYDKYKRKYKNK